MLNKHKLIIESLSIFYPNYAATILKYKVPKFIEIISKEEYNLLELGVSSATISKFLKELLPDREKGSKGGKPCTHLLSKLEYKWCGGCRQVHPYENFRKNSAKKNGINTYCKECQLSTTKDTQAARQSEYRASKLNRTPSWANLFLIKQFYSNCPKGYHVDHIVPLQGKLVSGLHVIENLQYLLAEENCSKHNKFII